MGSGSGADAARHQARAILANPRFHPSTVPHPFQGVLRAIGKGLRPLGRVLAPVGRELGRLLAPVGHLLGNLWVQAAVVALVAASIALVLAAHARRRSRAGVERGTRALGGEGEEAPEALDRLAEEAERAGALDQAVRLRFRAGLARLERGGHIRRRSSATTRDLRSTLASAPFDDLARRLEEIVYAGRQADTVDLAAARREWPQVLSEAAARAGTGPGAHGASEPRAGVGAGVGTDAKGGR